VEGDIYPFGPARINEFRQQQGPRRLSAGHGLRQLDWTQPPRLATMRRHMACSSSARPASGCPAGTRADRWRPIRRIALRCVLLAAAAGSLAQAAEVGPSDEEVEASLPEGGTLTGREIYERFLDNRLEAAHQFLRIISTDPGGSEQLTKFELWASDYRDEDNKAVDEVLAKNLASFNSPYDMRGTSYLMIAKDPGPDLEYVYRPSDKRVKRVNLKNTSIAGSDFTFSDLAFQDIEDADYERLPDEVIEGTPVFVVEATMKAFVESEYAKVVNYLEKEHYVPIRTRYWDKAEVETKEMRAPIELVKEFDGVWVATESVMRNLQENTKSALYVDDLDPNPEISDRHYSLAKLTRGK
jgi:hypothetical protein